MSEHILRLLLSELSVARICCKKCSTVVEVKTTDLDTLQSAKCPGCDQYYYPPADRSLDAGFLLIKRAIDAANQANRYSLEFSVNLDSLGAK